MPPLPTNMSRARDDGPPASQHLLLSGTGAVLRKTHRKYIKKIKCEHQLKELQSRNTQSKTLRGEARDRTEKVRRSEQRQKHLAMESIEKLMPAQWTVWVPLLLTLPMTLAGSNNKPEGSSSTATIVVLTLLFILLCVLLVLAWRKLIHTEGGEGYHPRELWWSAQELVRERVDCWDHQEGEEGSLAEVDNQLKEGDESDLPTEEPHITAL
ncbi:uncharacterized protein O3C94_017954 [Discoglossus pictus]